MSYFLGWMYSYHKNSFIVQILYDFQMGIHQNYEIIRIIIDIIL
jgi:hypothetical protein